MPVLALASGLVSLTSGCASPAEVRARRATALEHRYGLEPGLAARLVASGAWTDLGAPPFPAIWDELRERLPLRALDEEDLPALERLGALPERDREQRLARLLGDGPVALAARLAKEYGYTFKVRDEPSLLALAGTTRAAQVVAQPAKAAFAALSPEGKVRRFPLEAVDALVRLGTRDPIAIAAARARLVRDGLDPGVAELDPRALDLVAAAAADERVLVGADAIGAKRPFPGLALADAVPAALARLGEVEPKRLRGALEDLAHARGFADLTALDPDAAATIAALAEADATAMILAIETAFDGLRVPRTMARDAIALRSLAAPARAHELFRRAARAGFRPGPTLGVPPDASLALERTAIRRLLEEPRLVGVLEGARAAAPRFEPSAPDVLALAPLAARPEPADLLRAAVAAGIPAAELAPSARALAELDASGGRPVLDALPATFPELRLRGARDAELLSALVRAGLTQQKLLVLDRKLALAGAFDETAAAAIARAAGFAFHAPPGREKRD